MTPSITNSSTITTRVDIEKASCTDTDLSAKKDVAIYSTSQTRNVLRKLDLRLLILLCLLYLFNCLDRANISNAKLSGLEKDLGITDQQYQWCLSIFFFGYLCFELPSNVVIRRWNYTYWITFLMLSWGIVACCMAACKGYAGLALCRFLLGVFEGGYLPGVMYIFSLWYTRQEFARRIGYVWIASPMAGAVGGLLAYGISAISTSRLTTWQWLFLIEGLPSIALAFVTAIILPSRPETAKFLTKEERDIVIYRVATDVGTTNDDSWSWMQVYSIFKELKTYYYILLSFSSTVALQGVTLFLPSIIAGMGSWSTVTAQALTTPPYILAVIAVCITCWSSDKLFNRAYHMIVLDVIAMAGFLMLMFVNNSQTGVRYFATCLVTLSLNSSAALRFAWISNNYAGLTRRATANAMIASIGLIGGAVGGQIYYDPPRYFHGHTIAFSCVTAHLILSLVLRITLSRENRKRDNMDSQGKEKQIQKYGNPQLVGDRHPDFRYVL